MRVCWGEDQPRGEGERRETSARWGSGSEMRQIEMGDRVKIEQRWQGDSMRGRVQRLVSSKCEMNE